MAAKEFVVTEETQSIYDDIEKAKHHNPETLPYLYQRLAFAIQKDISPQPEIIKVSSRCPRCGTAVYLLCAEPWFFYIYWVCCNVRQSGKGILEPKYRGEG